MMDDLEEKCLLNEDELGLIEWDSGTLDMRFIDSHPEEVAAMQGKLLTKAIPIIRKAVELEAYEKGLADGIGEKTYSEERAREAERERISVSFLKYLTQDSITKDARRKDFNRAIFMEPSAGFHGGEQVFNGTDLDMVMEKFGKALKEEK